MSDSAHDDMDLQQPDLVPSSIDGSALLELGDDDDENMTEEARVATPDHTFHAPSEPAPSHPPQPVDFRFDGSVYQEPVFKLVTGRLADVDQWEANTDIVKYKLADGMSGSFRVPDEMTQICIAKIVQTMAKTDEELIRMEAEHQIDLVQPSIRSHLQLVLRNLIAEIDAAGHDACPMAPRSLAEVITRLGHGYGADRWEADNLLRDAIPRISEDDQPRTRGEVEEIVKTRVLFTEKSYHCAQHLIAHPSRTCISDCHIGGRRTDRFAVTSFIFNPSDKKTEKEMALRSLSFPFPYRHSDGPDANRASRNTRRSERNRDATPTPEPESEPDSEMESTPNPEATHPRIQNAYGFDTRPPLHRDLNLFGPPRRTGGCMLRYQADGKRKIQHVWVPDYVGGFLKFKVATYEAARKVCSNSAEPWDGELVGLISHTRAMIDETFDELMVTYKGKWDDDIGGFLDPCMIRAVGGYGCNGSDAWFYSDAVGEGNPYSKGRAKRARSIFKAYWRGLPKPPLRDGEEEIPPCPPHLPTIAHIWRNEDDAWAPEDPEFTILPLDPLPRVADH